MDDYLIKKTTLENIAKAIRSKTGSQSSMKPAEMATAISNISTGGGGSVIPSGLTATVNDVAFGKTFIGANGVTETGSLNITMPENYDGNIDIV